jgi:hypothetical protein
MRSLHEVAQQISQMLAPGRLLESFQDLRMIAAVAMTPTAMPKKGLSAANQEEMFQSEFSGVGFLFMPLFSSVRRPTFQKISRNRRTADNAD